MIRGALMVNSVKLSEGDGLAITNESNLILEGLSEAEFLFFDMSL